METDLNSNFAKMSNYVNVQTRLTCMKNTKNFLILYMFHRTKLLTQKIILKYQLKTKCAEGSHLLMNHFLNNNSVILYNKICCFYIFFSLFLIYLLVNTIFSLQRGRKGFIANFIYFTANQLKKF